MALRRFHFLNPVIYSQTHTLKGWPRHRLVKMGLATRPSIAKWQFQISFLFVLGVWVKLVALNFIREKITQDAWNMFLHLQVKTRHIIWQTFFTWMSFQTCHWRGYLLGCFNAPNFPLTRLQFSTRFPNSLAHIHLAASLLICVLPVAFKKFSPNKQGPVTGTSSARNVMHLEQIWVVECLLLGFHAQKKQWFVLSSWWIITVTTEHGATCADCKMRPDDLLMHH